MGRTLVFVVVCAVLAPSVVAGVELNQGWQMVNFLILEPMPLERFDLIINRTGQRKTFAEASAPGSSWVEKQLWWYHNLIQGYRTAGLADMILPDYGYWVYSYSLDVLEMVPTYDVREYMQWELGSHMWCRRLEWFPGPDTNAQVHLRTHDVLPDERLLCELTCRGVRRAHFVNPDTGDEYLEGVYWYSQYDPLNDVSGCIEVGLETFPSGVGLMSYRIGETDPRQPYLFTHSRMCPGQHVALPWRWGEECGVPNWPPWGLTNTVKFIGPEEIDTAEGTLMCLKFLRYDNSPMETEMVWMARGMGEVRRLQWRFQDYGWKPRAWEELEDYWVD